MPTYGELFKKYPSEKAQDILVEWSEQGLTPVEAERRLLFKSLDLKRRGKNVGALLGLSDDFDIESAQRQFAQETEGFEPAGAGAALKETAGEFGKQVLGASRKTGQRILETGAAVNPALIPLTQMYGESGDPTSPLRIQRQLEGAVIEGVEGQLPQNEALLAGSALRGASAQTESPLDRAAAKAMKGDWSGAMNEPGLPQAFAGALFDFDTGPSKILGSLGMSAGLARRAPTPKPPSVPAPQAPKGISPAELLAGLDAPATPSAPAYGPLAQIGPGRSLPSVVDSRGVIQDPGKPIPFPGELEPRRVLAPARPVAPAPAPFLKERGPTGTDVFVTDTPNPARNESASHPGNQAIYADAIKWFQERNAQRPPMEGLPEPDPQMLLPGTDTPRQLLPPNQWFQQSGREKFPDVGPAREFQGNLQFTSPTVKAKLQPPTSKSKPTADEAIFRNWYSKHIDELADKSPEEVQTLFSQRLLEIKRTKKGGKKKSKPPVAGGTGDEVVPNTGTNRLPDDQFHNLQGKNSLGEDVVFKDTEGVPYHTNAPLKDIPRSQSLSTDVRTDSVIVDLGGGRKEARALNQNETAKFEQRPVVDSTRYSDERFPLDQSSLLHNPDSRGSVRVPVDANGNVSRVGKDPISPSFAETNPAAFPDRLPMGDRQGDTLRAPFDRNLAKIREGAAQSDLTKIRNRAEELNKPRAHGNAKAAAPKPDQLGRMVEAANSDPLVAKDYKLTDPKELPSLKDISKKELSQLDDYVNKSGRFESIGSSIPDPRNIFRKSFTAGSGTSDWHRQISTLLNKFGGEKAVADKQMAEFITHELAERTERRPHVKKAFVEAFGEKVGKQKTKEWEQTLIKQVRAEAEKFIKTRHAIARRAFLKEALKAGLDGKEARKLIHTFDQTTGMFDSLIGKTVDALKTIKVLGSGAAYVNNTVGNAMFLFLAGTRGGFRQAVKELSSKGPIFQEALRNGVLGSEFFSKEASAVLKELDRALAKAGDGPQAYLSALGDAAHKAQGKAAAFYDYSDKMAKLATYIDQRTRLKKTPAQAAQHVYEHFPNYERIGVSFQRMRKQKALAFFANPFMAFPLEAMRILKNSVANDPIKLGILSSALYMAYEGALARAVATKEEIDEARQRLPSYQRFGGRFTLPLPIRDENGDLRFIDATYMVPLMDLLNAGEYKGEGPLGLAGSMFVNGVKQFMGRGFLNPEKFGPEGPGLVQETVDAVRSGSPGEMSRSPIGKLVLPPLGQRILEANRVPGFQEEADSPIKQGLAAFGIRTMGGETSDLRRESETARRERELDAYVNRLDFDKNLSEEEKDRRIAEAEMRYERYLSTVE